MATSLKHNLTSAYFNAANKLYPKKARRRIVAYVESYDDVAFWRTLLAEFETDDYYFQVMLPSATSLAKGKKMVLMNTLNTTELGKSLIACVDSDYDFLLQGKTNVSHKINSSPYIFQTYAYAIENFHCYAESLHEVCVQATLNDRMLIDFPAFLKRYSQIIYPLFFVERLVLLPTGYIYFPDVRFQCLHPLAGSQCASSRTDVRACAACR